MDEDGLRVRPNHKRCIVILREIDGSTPVEEVRAILTGAQLPNIVSCEFAHNNVWYVTFESDDDAQRAYHYVRDNVKEYKVGSTALKVPPFWCQLPWALAICSWNYLVLLV